MSDEKVTPELVNEMACNAIAFQKNPLKTWIDVKEIDPTLTKSHENAWKYESPKIFVLYESGKIVYDNKLYYMNEQTRNILLKTLKDQEQTAKRKQLGHMIRYTIAVGTTVIAVIVIAHSINNAIKSKQSKTEQQTKEVQSVRDSALNANDTVAFCRKIYKDKNR